MAASWASSLQQSMAIIAAARTTGYNQLDQLIRDHYGILLGELHQGAIVPHGEVADTLIALQSSPFSVQQRRDMIVAITQRQQQQQQLDAPSGHGRAQDGTNVHHYFTQNEWNLLTNTDTAYHRKLYLVAHKYEKLGLANPNECTMVHGVALVLVSAVHAGSAEPQILNHDDAYQMLLDFKSALRATRGRARQHEEEDAGGRD